MILIDWIQNVIVKNPFDLKKINLNSLEMNHIIKHS